MRSLAVVAFALVFLATHDARAQTQPITGAVAFPSSVPLLLPFPAGNDVRIIAGYGPAMGSGLHADTNATNKANDHYALDLVYENEPNSGLGLPIVAALAGEVVKAGWATEGWANYGMRVILRHDLGDGHVYHSIYCHLNAIDGSIVEGAMVGQGQPLGELGRSCQGALSCASFSTPHLHWAIHRDSTVGGSGTGGSYGGNAVVPEPLDGALDLVQNDVISSNNTSEAVCGDGFCSGDEDPTSCPDDCPVCASIPPTGRIIDDAEELCFGGFGTPSYWHSEAAGWDGSLRWTTATDGTVDNYGVWSLSFEVAGDYAVEVYTDAAFAQSKLAAYQVNHLGATDTVVVDQSAVDGWQSLGTFAFDTAGGQTIRLDDVTGEALAEDKRLVFDAIRLTGSFTGGTGGQGGGASPSSTASASAASGGVGTGGGDGATGAAAPSGCGCAMPGRRTSSWPLWLPLALAWIRRSRRDG